MSSAMLFERQNNVGILTLNRPDQANVIDAEMATALIETVATIEGDHSLSCLLIQSKGSHFCAGGDIKRLQAAGSNMTELLKTTLGPLQDAIRRLSALPIPVVAALNGPVAGGGIGLAFCADIVLAGESMRLRGGYSAIGLSPDLGSSWFLNRLVGPMRAKSILFTNEVMSSRQCLEMGLLSQVVSDTLLPEVALKVAHSLSASSTHAIGLIKSLLDGCDYRSLSEHLGFEYESMIKAAKHHDAYEGVKAFTEKRKPKFSGGWET